MLTKQGTNVKRKREANAYAVYLIADWYCRSLPSHHRTYSVTTVNTHRSLAIGQMQAKQCEETQETEDGIVLMHVHSWPQLGLINRSNSWRRLRFTSVSRSDPFCLKSQVAAKTWLVEIEGAIVIMQAHDWPNIYSTQTE